MLMANEYNPATHTQTKEFTPWNSSSAAGHNHATIPLDHATNSHAPSRGATFEAGRTSGR
eukprot:SAG22_NODE_9059_length_612_cov_1.001949_1_plen_59_part_01